MKIGIVGKGGAGKTTLAGMLARSIAAQGRTVIALDCDSNPNLGIALGFGAEETERLAAIRQAIEEGKQEHAPTAAEPLDRFGTQGPDGVRLAVVSRIDRPSPG